MSKIRVIDKSGQVRFIQERILTPNYLKRMGLVKDVIEKPDVKEEKKEEIQVEYTAETKEEAVAKYKEVFGKKPHHSWELSTLIEKINNGI